MKSIFVSLRYELATSIGKRKQVWEGTANRIIDQANIRSRFSRLSREFCLPSSHCAQSMAHSSFGHQEEVDNLDSGIQDIRNDALKEQVHDN